MEGHHLRAGRYLHATADVGMFETSLTTDLLNHLVFVQKVFMKVSTVLKYTFLNLSVLTVDERRIYFYCLPG